MNSSSKYKGDKWDKCSRFLSSDLNAMVAYPENTLRPLGFDPEEFSLRKRRFPQGVLINGVEINPFPILIVKDKMYAEWAKNLVNLPEPDSDKAEDKGIDYSKYDIPY